MLNEHVKFMHPKLSSLEKSIMQAMMPIPFEVYVSSMIFFSMIAGVCGVIMGLVSLQFINIQPASIGFLLPILSGLMLFGMTFGFLRITPSIKVKNRASRLVEEIPHFIGYMSTLATSGLIRRNFQGTCKRS